MSYRQELQENNAELEAILSVVNDLPTASPDAPSASGLPNIRFVAVRDVNGTMKLSEDNPYTFIVENMGGGTLQVGDILQICAMRWYKKSKSDGIYKKQRLRHMRQYEITEDDIDKRFLQISVEMSDNTKWLFHSDRSQGNSLSCLYFRLKRVTSYDTDGNENNAIFSNVVRVMKTYHGETNKLSIK